MSEFATERRITIRLLSYWEKLRGNRMMPAENEINADDLQDLWDHCFLIRIADAQKEEYLYSYLGDSIAQAYKSGIADDPKGLVSPNVAKLSGCYAQIIATQKPLIDEGEFLTARNELVKYRQCLLPLGRNGKVGTIFGGMRFKVFKQAD